MCSQPHYFTFVCACLSSLPYVTFLCVLVCTLSLLMLVLSTLVPAPFLVFAFLCELFWQLYTYVRLYVLFFALGTNMDSQTGDPAGQTKYLYNHY